MDKLSFENYLEYQLKSYRNHRVVIACSTGVDSMGLLRGLMNIWPNELITVAHVNHQKRKESDLEEKYIIDFCKEQQIQCFVKKLEYDGCDNFQEWAREQRYVFFKEVIQRVNGNILLTAHHADDNLETILMRFIKSSNLQGYSGIKMISVYPEYTIIRPLLDLSKEDIYEYMNICGYKYFEDYSNKTDMYTRNRIRKEIVPVIKKENPNWLKSLHTYTTTIEYASELLKKEVNLFIKQFVSVNNNIIKIDQQSFLQLDYFMQIECLFTILYNYQLSKSCIEEIIKQIKSNKKTIINNIDLKLLFIKEYGQLIFTNIKPHINYYLEINESGEYKLPNNKKIFVSIENKNICYFDSEGNQMCYNIQDLPIVIRSRKNGDQVKTKGGTKKISDILTNKKISHLERPNILVLENKHQEIKEILGLKI